MAIVELPRRDDSPEPDLVRALELCSAFQRYKLFPKDQSGLEALGRGLVKASKATGIPMESIVEKCLVLSEFCPTDFDLDTVAREIKAKWLEEINKAKDIPIPSKKELSRQFNSLAQIEANKQIDANKDLWHDQFRAINSRIKAYMGSGWAQASTRQKVEAGIEMGLKIYVDPPPGQSLGDMGIGIFVPRRELQFPAPIRAIDAGKRAAGERDELL